jgi:VIT1/CCC1 family predicted Fe2+/Mn2+ transporter
LPAEVERHIHNERVKLASAWLNGLSVAMFAVGGLAPVVAAFSGDRVLTWIVVLVAGVCFLGSCALHYTAVRNLKELLE